MPRSVVFGLELLGVGAIKLGEVLHCRGPTLVVGKLVIAEQHIIACPRRHTIGVLGEAGAIVFTGHLASSRSGLTPRLSAEFYSRAALRSKGL